MPAPESPVSRPRLRLTPQFAGWSLAAAALPLLWWCLTRQGNPSLPQPFSGMTHSLMEFGTLVAGLLLFNTGLRAAHSPRRTGLFILAMGFGGAGLIDLYRIVSESQGNGTHSGDLQTAQLLWLLARVLVNAAVLAYVLIPAKLQLGTTRAIRVRPLATAISWMLLSTAVGIGLTWPLQDLNVHWGMWVQHALALLIGASSLATLATLWLQFATPDLENVHEVRIWAVLTFLASLFYLLPESANGELSDLLGDAYRVCSYIFLYQHIYRVSVLQSQQQTLKELRENMVLIAVPDGILVVDAQGRILMLNPEMERLSGYRERELLGKSLELLVAESRRRRHGPHMRQFFASPRARAMGLIEIELCRRDGSELPVDISVGQITIHGAPHAIAYVRDLSEMKQARDTLRHSSTHDELTGLPNRWLFGQSLNDAIRDAERQNLQAAVMLLDLDNFKAVNDGFGHSTGDALLCQVTERIRESLGPEDFLARLGGDEFAILLKSVTDAQHVHATAARILKALERPYLLKDQEVNSGGSLGIAFFPDDAHDSDGLLRCADIAMYSAKHTGRGASASYSPAMRGESLENLAVHARLKVALRDGGLELHFQPQVSVHNGAIVGAEALVRWNDPKLGSVSPAKFIPIAEATGLILPLSEWILDEACRTLAHWQKVGMEVPIAVNFSAHQFYQPNLFEKVHATLQRHGVPPKFLDIEITETAAMNHPENTRTQINALVNIGCNVTLDDFGTGYSSLAYLKDFPVSKLKIDKSFMDGIPDGKHDITICKAIMAMARNLNIRLVAEGVEHTAQLDFLRHNGCDMYQGWLFAKAMNGEQLLALYHQHSTAQPVPVQPTHPDLLDEATLSRMHLHPQALDLNGALRRMGGNASIYRHSAQNFCDSLALLLPALSDARGAGNRQLGSMLLHSYKGNAATVGLKQFAKYMAHLEAILASENWQFVLDSKYGELQSWILATQNELARVLTELAQRSKTAHDKPRYETRARATANSKAQAPHANAPPDLQGEDGLMALQSLLSASDLTALELYAAIRPSLHGLPASKLQALDDALNNLNLSGALELCTELLESTLSA